MNNVALPPGYSFRTPTLDDAAAVAAVIAATELAQAGTTDTTETSVRSEWSGIDLAEEAAVVVDSQGEIVASVEVLNRAYMAISVYGFVHPDVQNKGIGRALVEWGEHWTLNHLNLAPADARITVQHYIHSGNQAARRLLEDAGYAPIRTALTMEIDLEEPLPTPALPEGIHVRPLRPGLDERITYETVEDTFRDLWGRPRNTWERFLKETEDDAYDPDLWFLAWDGDEVAGLCLCKIVGKQGSVLVLGVRRSWRGQGLGLALLHHSFGAFRERGIHNVWLSVDGESLTGATRLYERAGMHVTGAYIIHLKELRAGVDYSQHALEA